MESAMRNASESWWLFLVEGVVSVIFGIVALVWPGPTLAVVIAIFGLYALIMGIIVAVSAVARAGTGQPWGWRLTSGLLGVLAGLIILRWPGVTAVVVLIFIGIWLITTGLIEVVSAVAGHEEIPHAWLLALGGIVSVLFGVAMFVWPSVGLLTVIYLVGIYAIVWGLVFCVIAFRVRSLGRDYARSAPPVVDSTAPSY
jgi:uncharacterized membrane protein HdeD (DUF308 family)